MIVVWNCKDNRRLFFENFAKHHQFDPLVASHWSDHKHHLSSLQVRFLPLFIILSINSLCDSCRKWIRSYTITNTAFREHWPICFLRFISHLVPLILVVWTLLLFCNNLNSPTSKVIIIIAGFWRDVNNRKHFFENYAKKRGFDPLSASHWYKQPIEKIGAEKVSFYFIFIIIIMINTGNKDVRRALVHHQGSVVTALAELFPTINFDQTMFGKTNLFLIIIDFILILLLKDAMQNVP